MHVPIPSLTRTARRLRRRLHTLRRHATAYLESGNDPRLRAGAFAWLLAEQARVGMSLEKNRAEISRQDDLMALLGRAHAEHAATEESTLVVPGLRREYEEARSPGVAPTRYRTTNEEEWTCSSASDQGGRGIRRAWRNADAGRGKARP
jgi:hypothetical protein